MAIGKKKEKRKTHTQNSHLQKQLGMSIRTEYHSNAVKLMKMDESNLMGWRDWLSFDQKEYFNKLINIFQDLCHHFVFSKYLLFGIDIRSGRYHTIYFKEKASVTSNEDVSSSVWNLSIEFRTKVTFSKVVAVVT